MIRTIVILQKNGYELREPYSKMLNEGILELRAKDWFRYFTSFVLFYCRQKSSADKMALSKKHKKTPKEELERAKQYRAEYLSRKERDLT